MLVFDDEPKVGDVYRIVDVRGTGMTKGRTIEITQVSLDGGRCVTDCGMGYSWTQAWIEDGSLVKEEPMGIVFEEEPQKVAAAEPVWGRGEVEDLRRLIAIADADANVKRALRDCINVRYRSKQYRDYINAVKPNHITEAQIAEMKGMLDLIRHNQRTPQAKSFRWQWP